MSGIDKISGFRLIDKQNVENKATGNNKNQASFKDTVKQLLNEVNDLQHASNNTTEKFLDGEVTDVHQVMVASEKASVSLQLTLEIRNKLLEGYREIMRMQ